MDTALIEEKLAFIQTCVRCVSANRNPRLFAA